QTIRDEAHRFALTYHRKLRSNHQSKAALDGIEGVGPKRKRQLIKHFGSLSAVYAATLDQLLAVPGLPETVAQRIFEQTARN
ncbi:MAG TPA: helix-hairpin-helix domain-containing protein, partial [Limnochordia bacterium]|nr:helix-hairpin-helix domain-containing protein [Limnochordia bacterium]